MPGESSESSNSESRNSDELPDSQDLTKNTKKIAEIFGCSEVAIRRAIHSLKRDNLPTSGSKRNPDVQIDLKTGEVYPEIEGGRVGDSIGNILDYLL